MLPKITKEILAAFLLFFIVCICYYNFLPEGTRMMTHSVIVILFGVVALFLWRERPADEREQTHQRVSAEVAFIAGGVVLVGAIVYEGLSSHHIHPSLYFAFGAMLLGKILGRLWAQRYM